MKTEKGLAFSVVCSADPPVLAKRRRVIPRLDVRSADGHITPYTTDMRPRSGRLEATTAELPATSDRGGSNLEAHP